MAGKAERIGISGGTFDPIHYGHLIIAEETRENLGLDRVIFIPAGKPPHKEAAAVSDASHRYRMVCEAVGTNPFFEVSDIEIKRPGYTYTVDTLNELKSVYGENAKLFFITGADVIRELLIWKECGKVFGMCEFVAALRPGYDKDDMADWMKYLADRFNAVIHVAEAPLIGISSTQIREKVKKGKSIKYLVPESVERYIYENGLYRNGRA